MLSWRSLVPLCSLLSLTACFRIPGTEQKSIWTDDITTIELLLTGPEDHCDEIITFSYKMSGSRLTPRRVTLFKSLQDPKDFDPTQCRLDYAEFKRSSFIVNPGMENTIHYATQRDACLYYKNFEGRLLILPEEDMDRVLQEITPKRFGFASFLSNETDVFYGREYDSERGPFGKILEGANPLTFRVLKDPYGVDDKAAWMETTRIEGADPGTFLVKDWAWSQDLNRPYYNGQALPGVDMKSFQIVGSPYSKDGTSVYHMNRKIVNVNPSTFQLYFNGLYIRDDKLVIYDDVIVEGADIQTFSSIPYGYATDTNFVYFGAKRLDLKRAAFVDLKQGYAKDDSNVYFYDKRVEGADPATFEVETCISLTEVALKCVPSNNSYCNAKDKNARYRNGVRY
jgi:hypothetical protein